jgi:hypothetical protein
MHHGNGYALKQTKSDKSLLLVGKPIIFKRECRSRKYLWRINEVQAVGFQIRLALILIPLVLHLRSVYTFVATRKRWNLPASAQAQRRAAGMSHSEGT